MRAPTAPGNPDGSDGAGGDRRRGIASIAGATSVLAGAVLPTGLITTTPNGAATETFTGNPTQVGTFTFLVTVMDSEPGIPPVTASTTFTIVINQDPTVKRLP
ncbi:MAG TPA: hypothetical protein VH594_16155 [Trebonia sp.]|jgi:hypothetical protein